MSTIRRDSDPIERPLAFDSRGAAPRRGPAPVSLLLSLVLLVGLGGGVYFLYRGGVRAPSGPPAPVGVPIRDVRVAAPPQPQTVDPAAGLTIYKDTPGAAQSAPTFVAAPEQPTPRPVPGQEVLVAPAAGPIAAAPADAVAKPVKTASIDSILASGSATEAKPAAKPAAVKIAPVKIATEAPKAATPAKTAAAKSGSFVVQIGAFSSEALAQKSWDEAAGVAPGAMAGKGKHIAPLNKGGATLYRVAITGFDDRASAQALCARLSAAGRTCFVR